VVRWRTLSGVECAAYRCGLRALLDPMLSGSEYRAEVGPKVEYRAVPPYRVPIRMRECLPMMSSRRVAFG
jgi:hypothetical protein